MNSHLATRDRPLDSVTSNTYLLLPHTVTDLDDFTEHHDRYLVSVFDEPARAGQLWRERLKRNPYGDEGFVSVQHYGRDLISGDLWDQVGGIWLNLVELVEEFHEHGHAFRFFPDQPTPMKLRRQQGTELLTIGSTTTVLEPATFYSGLLHEAERYFQWVVDNIGIDAENVATVRRIRDGLPYPRRGFS